jgi:AcrR family transcriptional regulator
MGIRERRKTETTNGLVVEARRLFSERGLSGFTVEELCEAVGISRRTFFNYFASKDDAVVGVAIREPDDELDDAFLAAGDPTSATISPTLFDDFVHLVVERWNRADVDAGGLRGVSEQISREPRLLARIMELAMRNEAMDVALVERREGLAPGDLRASSVVHLVLAFARPSAMEFLDSDNADPIGDILLRRIGAVRSVLL